MPNSQNGDTDINFDTNTVNVVDDKSNYQENQIQLPLHRSQTMDQMRLEQARMTDLLCILLILASITASALTFCITRNFLSFSFLSFLSFLSSMRRRKEEAIFPISAEDLQIKLKELDVEIERIKNPSTLTSLSLFTWLKNLARKRP